MATTEPEELADTIRSRSQHFHFRVLTFAEITQRLQYIARKEGLQIEPSALAVIARIAEGSMRDSLSLLEQARAYCGDTIEATAVRELLGVVPDDALDELVGAIAAGSAERALSLVHTFQKEGRNLQHFCREAIRHIRNLLIARVCGADSDLIAATPDQRPALARAAGQFSEEDLTRFYQILLQTDEDLRRKPDPRVHLEMGLLRLINAARLAPLEELLAEVRSGAPVASGASAGGTRGGAGSASRVQRAEIATPASVAPNIAPRTGAPAAATATAIPFRGETVAAHRVADAPISSQAAAFAFAAPAYSAPRPTPVASPVTAMKAPIVEERQVESESGSAEISAVPEARGLTTEQVMEIKAAIQAQQRFLGELIEHGRRWELEGAELRIFFSPDDRAFAEMLEGRESLEKVRGVSSKVLGRPVRVCAKLETVAAGAAPASRSSSDTQELRAQFERDPMVKSMLQRFGGRITEVKRSAEES
jgi:DNA polymerase III gamma/tau subunit